MYIARSPLRLAGRDGRSISVAPGEPVEDFASWPYPVRQAMLRLGRVAKVGGLQQGNLTTEGGYLHFGAAPAAATAAGAPPSEARCATCGADFTTRRRLARHLKTAHPEAA